MKRYFLTIICLFSVLFHRQADARTSEFVMDAKTGAVVYERQAEAARYPASLTKLMTLYVAFSALDEGIADMSDKLPVSVYASKQKKSKIWLKPNTYITLKNAILSVILRSANDAAVVIAEGLGGSEKRFAELMNEKAKEIGLSHTNFENANGLYNDDQKSTAKDLGLLAYAIMHNFPQYYPLFSKKTFLFNGKTYRSNNALLHYRDDVEGMKTGYVAKSGFHIIISVKRGNEKLITVIMGRNNPRHRDQFAMVTANKAFAMLKKYKENKAAGKKVKEREILTAQKPTFSGEEAYEIAVNLNNANANTSGMANSDAIRIYAENGAYGVQLGTFKSRKRALNAAVNAKDNLFAEGSEGADANVSKIIRNKKGIYTAKITDLSEEAATSACEEIKRKGSTCLVISPRN